LLCATNPKELKILFNEKFLFFHKNHEFFFQLCCRPLSAFSLKKSRLRPCFFSCGFLLLTKKHGTSVPENRVSTLFYGLQDGDFYRHSVSITSSAAKGQTRIGWASSYEGTGLRGDKSSCLIKLKKMMMNKGIIRAFRDAPHNPQGFRI
jgi:hypothetical protein